MAEYKIKDLETLTGIKAHTLRIWEKRYGLVQPDRTDTQIRTYTDQELVTLLNIALLNKHGYKISKIAQMSQDEMCEKVHEISNEPNADGRTEMLILALVELDEQLFHTTFNELVAEFGLVKTFSDAVIPFLDRIGVMWQVGSINPAQEHFISTLIRQKFISEIDKLPVPKRTEHPVVLFLPEHEWHELGLLFYNYVLRQKGIYTVYLGQSLPYDSLLECIEKLSPSSIISSWVTAVEPNFMEHYFNDLKKNSANIELYAGGFQAGVCADKIRKNVKLISSTDDLNRYFPIGS